MVTKSKKASGSTLGKAFAMRAVQVREARGLSQAYAESEAGLSRGTLSRIENGHRATDTSIVTAVNLARVYSVDVGWFITGIVPDGTWVPPKLDTTLKNPGGRWPEGKKAKRR